MIELANEQVQRLQEEQAQAVAEEAERARQDLLAHATAHLDRLQHQQQAEHDAHQSHESLLARARADLATATEGSAEYEQAAAQIVKLERQQAAMDEVR